jgi:hypothetical protein
MLSKAEEYALQVVSLLYALQVSFPARGEDEVRRGCVSLRTCILADQGRLGGDAREAEACRRDAQQASDA